MKRSLMQVYVVGSDKAVPRYQHAFGAPLVSSYVNANGTYAHAELDIQGQILAVAEADSEYGLGGQEQITGNTMQFCLHYGHGNEALVKKAYETLQEGGKVIFPLGPCEYSPLMADLIDAYGVRWCLFV